MAPISCITELEACSPSVRLRRGIRDGWNATVCHARMQVILRTLRLLAEHGVMDSYGLLGPGRIPIATVARLAGASLEGYLSDAPMDPA